ncbi:MAG: hypothetical protein EA369_00790 [Bradymonadales bacterium]|nr:MAG: hypothetical protein EA369_00790 [Bradymonadales bacterium]
MKRKIEQQKILFALLFAALALFLGACSAVVDEEDSGDPLDSTNAGGLNRPPPGGGGSPPPSMTDCYYVVVICSVQDFLNISNNLSGEYYLGRDIDFAGFQMNMSHVVAGKFEGRLNGQNFSIRNLNLVAGGDISVLGIFDEITEGAVVENLKLENVRAVFARSGGDRGILARQNSGVIRHIQMSEIEIEARGGSQISGALVGRNVGSIQNVKLNALLNYAAGSARGGLVGENSASGVINGAEIELSIHASSALTRFGGLAGRSSGEIRNIQLKALGTSHCPSSSLGQEIGGLIGHMNGGLAAFSSAEVDLCGRWMIGGIAGQVEGSSLIQGVTVSQSSLAGDFSQGNRVGGIVGRLGAIGANDPSTLVISDSEVLAVAITGTHGLGGLVGENGGKSLEILRSSVSASEIGKGIDRNNRGGLLGFASYTSTGSASLRIRESYFDGSLHGRANAGGLVGWINYSPTSSLEISNSFARGDMIAEQSVGGLFGRIFCIPQMNIDFVYSNVKLTGQQHSGGLVGETSLPPGVSTCVGPSAFWNRSLNPAFYNEANEADSNYRAQFGTALEESEMLGDQMFDNSNIWILEEGQFPRLKALE